MSAIAGLKEKLSEMWSLVVGLRITGREFARPQLTVHYPRQAVDTLGTFRGHIELAGKPGKPDVPRCISCMLCAALCPSGCISIKKAAAPKPPPAPAANGMPQADGSAVGPVLTPEKVPPPKAAPSKTPAGFTLDYTLCSLCGLCVQNCPVDSLRFSTDVYLAGPARAAFQYDLMARLRAQAPAVTAEPGGKAEGEEG